MILDNQIQLSEESSRRSHVMVNVIPVSHARHGSKLWRRPTSYGFVATAAVAPIGGSEFAQAVPAMPIGFIETSPGQYLPVAIMALSQGTNLFVGAGGQWFGAYVPAVLRSYPFSLIRGESSDERVLGIDEDSGLVVENASGEGVEKFFELDGTPTAMVKTLTELLRFIERDQVETARAVSALAEAGVIKPWPLTVQVGNQDMTVSGLYRVDEPALNALDDETFLKLRRASSLLIAYGQLLSMVQVQALSRLTVMQQTSAQIEKSSLTTRPM
jgi:hypothetical protein